jgi:hypothetical protein
LELRQLGASGVTLLLFGGIDLEEVFIVRIWIAFIVDNLHDVRFCDFLDAGRRYTVVMLRRKVGWRVMGEGNLLQRGGIHWSLCCKPCVDAVFKASP